MELQPCADVVTQKTFNSVWFPLFKGVLWSGCAGYNCCLKLALRSNLFVPWGGKYSSLKSVSVMSHVHTGELTEGRWVGKANLSFIDWMEQKCQAINLSWGVLERYECFSLLSLFLLLIYCECLFVGFRMKVTWLLFLKYFSRCIISVKMYLFSSELEEDGVSMKQREIILHNSATYFVSGGWKCLCSWYFCMWLISGT